MTGINALSARGAMMNTEDGSSFTGGSRPEADSAAAMFAAILGGWLNQMNGQGQDSENQSNEPAGKEANSGRHALLGLEGLQGLMVMMQAESKQSEASLGNPGQLEELLTQLEGLRSQNTPSNPLDIMEVIKQSGKIVEQPQGKGTPQTELDLYKNVIANLLKEMSGAIEHTKGQVNPGHANPLAQRQLEMAAQRFNSGLFMAPEGEGQPTLGEGNKVQVSEEVLGKVLSQVSDEQDVHKQSEQGNNKESLSQGGESAPGSQEYGLKTNTPIAGEKSGNQGVAQDFTLSGALGVIQTPEAAEIQGRSGDKALQPIWTQVAKEIFEKAYQARPMLRELTIRLYPAELGAISIAMNWEEGQVHLRMVASEAGTGQMLQTNFSELRENLSQLGVQCGSMEVGLGEQKEDSQEHQGRESYPGAQDNGEETSSFLSSEEIESISYTARNDDQEGSTRINVTA